MADRPVLVGKTGAISGHVFPIPEGDLDLGRAPENHVVIDEAGVSRFHARLRYDNGTLWIRDAGSRNGVFVNGQRVADHKALRVGDVVRIADTELEVRWEAPDAPIKRPPEGSEGPPKGNRRKGWFWS